MPHDKNGALLEVDDIVSMIGRVVSVSPGEEACNLSVEAINETGVDQYTPQVTCNSKLFQKVLTSVQALPSADTIWKWAIDNSSELAGAIQRGIEADGPREVWSETKIVGDILIDLFDPKIAASAVQPRIAALGFADSIPWDQVVAVLLPAILDMIRRRREKRGA